MKFATILVSMLIAGSAFAQGHDAAPATAPAGDSMAAPAGNTDAKPAKKEHKKKGKKKKGASN